MKNNIPDGTQHIVAARNSHREKRNMPITQPGKARNWHFDNSVNLRSVGGKLRDFFKVRGS